MPRISLRGGANPALVAHVMVLLVAVVPGAMATSVRSVYLITTAHIDPFLAGSFNYASTLLGITFVYYAARGHLDRLNPVVVSVLASVCALAASLCVLSALYSPLFLVGATVFNALAQVGGSSIFLYDERYGPRGDADTGLYRTRLLLSVAWIVAPPLSFVLFWIGGFPAVVAATALFGAVSSTAMIMVSRTRSPSTGSGPGQAKPASGGKEGGLGFWPIFAIMVATACANVLHSTNMPLYLIQVQHAPTFWPGLIMGAAAFVEVVVIALLPRLTKATSDAAVLWSGLVLGIVYFALLSVVHEPQIILACQVLYGAHFAATTVVCLPMLRRALAGGTGSLAAQFNNASRIGGLTASALFAVLATPLGFYWILTKLCLGVLLAALGLGVVRRIVTRRRAVEA
ncbi:hypothetical protein [Rhizobium leguminosarum]|uniref:hypothetical protein n=1 Tax=Rhizobium leguminosarum TaxID=384 RepID=UPI001F40CF09|nr:hypothetical protein [Rhizobium leguminosarum]UIJ81759.1 hypothetical protein LZK78_10960 [Rhizobium leguminosarum]